MILNGFFSKKEIISKLIISILFVFLLLSPWIGDLKFNYDINLYLDLNHCLKNGFYKCILDNEIFLYLLKTVFRNVDNKILLITTYDLIITFLFCSLFYFVNNIKSFLSILLFTFFSIFAGQFREAFGIALGIIVLNLFLHNKKKYQVILALIFFIHFYTFLFILFILFSISILEKHKSKSFNLYLLLVLLMFFFVFHTISDRLNYYLKPTDNYAFSSILLLLLALILYKNLKNLSVLFILISLFCIVLIRYYHLSTRISEISIFFLILLTDYYSRTSPKLKEYIKQTNIIAVLFFVYKFFTFFLKIYTIHDMVVFIN